MDGVHSEQILVFRILESMEDIDVRDWQALIQADTSPFLEYHWLHACESSGSMVPETGWQTCHVLGFSSEDDAMNYARPVFILPLYIKSHSWGEFVFDFSWADLAAQIGQEYYPKAVGVIPATPVTAYQPLMAESLAESGNFEQILRGAIHFIRTKLEVIGVKSLSFLFTTPDFTDALESLEFSRWVHQGFEWYRKGMNSFDDYLATFGKNQRKNIRKERKSLQESGFHVRFQQGNELDDSLAHDMYLLYSRTNAQFGSWAAKFFNREFFEAVFRNCAENIVLVSAENDDGDVPGRSMLILKNGKLFGRYWGCHSFVKNMHFNLCYYDPIDFALRNGFQSFDPGMGGEHKLRRGFMPVEQYSMHNFFDPLMNRFFAEYIPQFNRHVYRQIEWFNSKHLPTTHEDVM